MKIHVNGQDMTLETACTVEQLLLRHRPAARACAVEVNRRIVPKKSHGQHMLNEGDSVEIVSLVGGG
jgi:sulfur carrier protein